MTMGGPGHPESVYGQHGLGNGEAERGVRTPRRRVQTSSETGIRMLPGEAVLASLGNMTQRLFLTDRRLIFYGKRNRLFFLPGGRQVAGATLRDVDAVQARKKHPLTWLILAGALLTLGALLASKELPTLSRYSNTVTWPVVIGIVLGIGMILLGYLYSSSELAFKVSGHQHFSLRMAGSSDVWNQVLSFTERYYETKQARDAGS